MSSEDRLAALEMRTAEQERTIEQMSDQITEQWKTVERLKTRFEALTERFLALEEQSTPAIDAAKPPHW